MNEVLIQNWNNTIPENGIVFHLGDFAFGGSEIWNKILSRLNGKNELVLVKHDHLCERFDFKDIKELKVYRD